MFNTRRSEIEIIAEILALSQDGARKTEVLYQANLSYKQLSNYILALVERDLLEEKVLQNYNGTNRHKIYTTTNKGNELLTNINIISSFFE